MYRALCFAQDNDGEQAGYGPDGMEHLVLLGGGGKELGLFM